MASYESILSIGAELQSSFGSTFSKLKGEFEAVNKSAKGAEGGVDKVTEATEGVIKVLQKKAIAVGIGTGLVEVGKRAIDLASDMEKLQTALTVHLRTPEAAQQLITDMQTFAKASAAFDFPDIAHAGTQMLAYGFDAKEVIPTISRLSDVAAGLGLRLEDIGMVYGTLKAQGRAYTQDVTQFTKRGVKMWTALTEVMAKSGETYTIGKGKNAYDVTGDQIRKEGVIQELVKAGHVHFEQVEKGFKELTGDPSKGYMGQFYQMGEKQGQTFSGRLNTLTDSIDQLLTKLGSPLIDVFGKALQTLNDSGAINAISAALGEMSKHMDVIAPLIVTIGAGFAAMEVASKIAIGIDAMKAAMVGARVVMVTFNALMLANPVGMIALGITLLVAGLALLIANWDKVTAAAKGAFEWMGKALNVKTPEAPTNNEQVAAIARQAEQAGAGGGIGEALSGVPMAAPPIIDAHAPLAKAIEAAPLAPPPPPPPPPLPPAPTGPTAEDLAKQMESYNKAMEAAKGAPPIKTEVDATQLETAKNTVDTLANTSVPSLNSAVSSVGSSFNSWSVPPSLLSQMDSVVAKANEVKNAMSSVPTGPAVGGKQFGGLVSRPGLWRLAEKGVPEMVIPMQSNSRNIGLLAQAADQLGIGGGKGRGGPNVSGPINANVSPVINITGASGDTGSIQREVERAMENPVRILLEQLKMARDEEHRTAYV